MASIKEPKEKPSIDSTNTTTSRSAGSTEDLPIEEWKPTKELYVIFLTLCIITLAAALDATSISVALPIIAEKLHGSAVEAFWAGTSFLLCSTVFQPAYGSFSNIFGRKPLLLVAIVIFTAGSLAGALANNFTVLLIGRSLQGVGAGGIIALTEIILTDIIPLRLRGQYFGIYSSMWALGSVCGPILGGGFAQNVSWRWILYINLPFCVIAFVFVPIFLKLNQKIDTVWVKLARVDWIGTVMFIASVTAILIPISWGGVMYPWDHWRVLVPLVVGFASLTGFVLWEIYGAQEPLIALDIFMNRTAAVTFFGTVMHGIVLWSMLYYLPLYFEAVKEMGPIMAGVAIFPQTFTVAPASIVVGILTTVTGRFRWAVWTGWVLMTTGMGLMYLLDVDTSTVKWVFLNLVAGLGAGMLFPSMASAVQASASNENMAIAVAVFSFLRTFGQSFGVAIGGVIFQNALIDEFSKYPGLDAVAGDYAKDAVALVQLIKRMPDSPTRQALMQSYADSLKMVWLAMAVFSAAGLIASVATEGLSLDRVLTSDQGIRNKKKPVTVVDA
ncbi:major facilitator superfamily domain-containing protein [Tricharina praecox]|uniref:major facilitator superfamily domain-containing protein n=1 Tax=Tricharina praecox TaxID=43433 RepID=UPI0022210703|nr:major facilitator superfamily domain-containing protein [Tricharina praecox]KAI5848328.1 major facilitator superfamily domain-containing protein [Tricharina praecox]